MQLSRQEQVTVSTGLATPAGSTELIQSLASAGIPQLGPESGRVRFREELIEFYSNISKALVRFLEGLSIWERLSESAQENCIATLNSVPPSAHRRYEGLLRQLAADFPEVASWAKLQEAMGESARAESKHAELRSALAGLESSIGALSSRGPRDELRESLFRAYSAGLGRPIVEAGDTPAGLQIPSLERGYISPAFKAASLTPADNPSNELWWKEQEIRHDLEQFLLAHFTSTQATNAPLLILGQPGSGKSVLTRIVSARLMVGDFLPVRVVLRDMPTLTDVQDLVEAAIRNMTGQRLNWVQVAGSSGGTLPVVLLDGFDELLQATGVSQTDYLIRIASFQQREAEQGRPLAVIVTSRVSVADRARAPEGTVAIRLQPFDEDRIDAWVERWNLENETYFGHGIEPFDSILAKEQGELAEQPLLLLMLALYDAEGNYLRAGSGQLKQKDLYDRLLKRFAEREVLKRSVGLDARSLQAAVEEELRRLGVVAFSMFNRLTQWVEDEDLQTDLAAVFGESPKHASGSLRPALRTADLALGSFFFIHKAEALAHEDNLQTYEFLHATFGEFLVARLTWGLLQDLALRHGNSSLSFPGEPINDDRLYDFTSFAVLSVRGPAISFLREMVRDSTRELRTTLAEVLTKIFSRVNEPRSGNAYRPYEPRSLGLPARCAAYGANLLLLIVCCGQELRATTLFPYLKSDPVSTWHYQTIFWRSQLTNEEWTSLVEAIAVDRLWTADKPDVGLRLAESTEKLVPIDPYWVYGDKIEASSRGQ